ncbi:hypothetical protein [Streptomyces sp. NPDC058623]|uniref:hypothetical protein n=1 Tax=Streptomyces sp. NPDC058623 TaxID=3346563 RepID=UPI00365F0DE6
MAVHPLGPGFARQRSPERDGASTLPGLLRRSLGLLVLGVMHAVLLYVGDILMTYALFGLVLIAARDCSSHAALRAARIVYGCLSALLLVKGLSSLLMSDVEAADLDAELAADFAGLIADYRGDAASVIEANLGQLPDALLASSLMGGFVLAAFLTGLHCGERRLLAETGNQTARMRRICVLGGPDELPAPVPAQSREL